MFNIGRWIASVAVGDFGKSIGYQVPVGQLVADRIVNTLILTFAASLVAVVIGFLGGAVAAVRRFTLLDRSITLSALIAASAPTFWFGLLMLYLFSLELRIFPAMGMYSLGKDGDLLNLLWHIPLPAIATSLISLAVILRLTRSGLLDIMGQDYIRAARARGLPERRVVYRHAVRSIIPPVVNISGLQVGFMFGSALFAEVIFQWPGVGLLMYNSISCPRRARHSGRAAGHRARVRRREPDLGLDDGGAQSAGAPMSRTMPDAAGGADAAADAAGAGAFVSAPRKAHRSELLLAWQAMARDRLALAGIVIFLAAVLLALLAPWLSPYRAERSVGDRVPPRPAAHAPGIGSAPTGRVAIS